jgi:hypothetical protein
MDAMTQNNAREAALPFIFHGTKALAELGYRKPRIISSHEELDTLPQDAVVRDAEGFVFDRDRIITPPHPLRWHPAGVAADVDSEVIELPATVLHEGDE